MNKIVKLEPNVFNMIAAGEVVERPSSVVKELIENSLDAGATCIDIDIEDGGKSLIRVSDNGIGMNKEDILLSIKPHATSKLFTAQDLSSISTFGFRGEALASIDSVSKIKIISCKNNECFAYDSKTKTLLPSSRVNGTTIEVKDLFYNTPARLKFLKTDKSEERYILEKVSNLILANPEVSISLTANKKILISSQGKDLITAMFPVYGSQADNFYKLNYEKDNFILKGYISPVSITHSSRSGQVIIVNGRVVKDNSLQVAVEKAYGSTLMKHNYPMYVISIVLPFDFVDVNVHPQKAEVRFQNPSSVFGAVYRAVSETLQKNKSIFSLNESLKETKDFEQLDFESNNKNKNNLKNNISANNNFKNPSNENDFRTNDISNNIKKETTENISTKNNNFNMGLNDILNENINCLNETAFNNVFNMPIDGNEKYNQKYSIYYRNANSNLQNAMNKNTNAKNDNDFSFNDTFEPLCSLFSTYLILKKGEEYYLVDQHAAHERILYNQLMENLKNNKIVSQPMLFSYSEIVSSAIVDKIIELMPSLNRIGFEIQIEGNKINFLTIPVLLTNIKIKDFLHNLTNSIIDVKLENLLYEKICQTACKAAIKGGDSFNREQLDFLIKTFNEHGLPLQCPHGRPAAIKIEKEAIEKLFKRIV